MGEVINPKSGVTPQLDDSVHSKNYTATMAKPELITAKELGKTTENHLRALDNLLGRTLHSDTLTPAQYIDGRQKIANSKHGYANSTPEELKLKDIAFVSQHLASDGKLHISEIVKGVEVSHLAKQHGKDSPIVKEANKEWLDMRKELGIDKHHQTHSSPATQIANQNQSADRSAAK